LNEWIIEFLGALPGSLYLAHCPIQGPQALVKIVAFTSSKVLMIPSLSAVNRTVSDPGFIPNSALVTNPLSTACLGMTIQWSVT